MRSSSRMPRGVVPRLGWTCAFLPMTRILHPFCGPHWPVCHTHCSIRWPMCFGQCPLVVGISREVVLSNLERAFPDESEPANAPHARKFYHPPWPRSSWSPCGIFMRPRESCSSAITMSIPKCWPLSNKPPGVLLSCGHYGNWERYAVTAGGALPIAGDGRVQAAVQCLL